MTGEQVFVSHAAADLDAVQQLFGPVRNFPFGVHVALEEISSGRSRHTLEARITNSDVVVAVLTERSVTDPWVNQEVGYATAKGIPVVPVYEQSDHRRGYLDRVEGVELDMSNPTVTIFNLLSRLRGELAPLGTLSTPNWFIRFPCNFEECGTTTTLDIQESQTELWKRYQHTQPLRATCPECGSQYLFDPATLGFLRRHDGSG